MSGNWKEGTTSREIIGQSGKSMQSTLMVPEIFSDTWLEQNVQEIRNQVSSGTLNIDMSITTWVELSALIGLCGIITKESLDSNTNINLFFPLVTKPYPNNQFHATVFLMESKFYLALQNKLNQKDGVCKIWLAFPGSTSNEIASIEDVISTYVKTSSIFIKEEIPIITASSKKGYPLIGINSRYLLDCNGIDTTLFDALGFGKLQTRDNFIIPIRYFKRDDLYNYIQNQNTHISLAGEQYLKENVVGEGTREILEDLSHIWLYELLLNAKEHGGEDILFCVRVGDWSIRLRKNNESVIGASYQHKLKFLQRRPDQKYHKFIDIYVADTGDGFKYLTENYEKEFNKKLTGKHKLKVLHRYSLYPHSSRKPAGAETDPLRTTGLGLIAEHTISYDGLLAIKDKEHLTFFEKNNLMFLSNEGESDFSSKNSFNITLVSALLPVPIIGWELRSSVFDAPINKGKIDNLIYVRMTSDKYAPDTIVTVKEHLVMNHEVVRHIDNIDELNYNDSEIVVIDITNVPPYKPKAQKIKSYIDICNNKGILAVIVGADYAFMNLLQSLVESSDRRISSTATGINSTFFCPMISNDYKVFICGVFDADQKQLMAKYYQANTYDPSLEAVFRHAKVTNFYIPFRSIERTHNRMRGKYFKELLCKNHYFKNPVVDIHGTLLDSFYEVKAFLAQEKVAETFIPDLVRIVSREAVTGIIVDSPELKALILKATKDVSIAVSRLNNGVIEPFNRNVKRSDRILLLLSCAFSGGTLKSVQFLKSQSKLPIVSVVTLLDLTGMQKKDLVAMVGCSYDRLAKADPPNPVYSDEVNIKYVATKNSRLIDCGRLAKNSNYKFETSINNNLLTQFLIKSKNIWIGHVVEAGHHYDVFFDVRNAMLKNDRISQFFRHLVYNKISSGTTAIVYPEESELGPIISTIRFAPGAQAIELLPVRHVVDDVYDFAKLEKEACLENKRVMVLDEGIYSCSSIIGILLFIVNSTFALADLS